MSKVTQDAKTPNPTVKVFFFYKDESDHGGFASAYGLIEIEISSDVLKKHGTIVSISEPDLFEIFMNNLMKKARDIFGI